MSRFSSEWLSLRENADARSRSAAILARLRADAPSGTKRIVDLATGTGANVRYLAPRLGGEQEWLLVDNDSALLGDIVVRMREWSAARGLMLQEQNDTVTLRGSGLHCRVQCLQLDLAVDADNLDIDGCWLVTASALLDLVGQHWLEHMVARCRKACSWLLFALTYDGHTSFSPGLPDDMLIEGLLNRHQVRDKGFGPALGPRAASKAHTMLRQYAYKVAEAPTPWAIGPTQTSLQSTLVQEWTKAAIEVAPDQVHRIYSWKRRRCGLIREGVSNMRVSHRDLLAWPVAGM